MQQKNHFDHLTRREFLASATAFTGVSFLESKTQLLNMMTDQKKMKKGSPIKMRHVDSNFEREPLIRPFGFKGGFLTEIWQALSRRNKYVAGVPTIAYTIPVDEMKRR